MTKYRKSALVVSVSFLILISLSIFLYSCGVSSPTGSSPNAMTTTTIPSSTASQAVQTTQPLMSASYTSTKLIITLSPNVSASHTLYMIQDSASKSAATFVEVALPQTTNNIYEVSLTPDDAYTFTLVETINNILVIRESLVVVPSILGKGHWTNFSINTNNNKNSSGNTNTSTNTLNGLSQSMMPMGLANRSPEYRLYITMPNKFDVTGVYYSVDVMTTFIPEATYPYGGVDTGIYTLKYHVWKIDDCADCLGLTGDLINSSPRYEYVKGQGLYRYRMPRAWVDNSTIDSVEFSGRNDPITIDLGWSYFLKVELVGGPNGLINRWDKRYLLAAITWSSSNPDVGVVDTSQGIPYFSARKPGTTKITASYNGIDSTNSVTFIVGGKKNITISPVKATIYIHHTDPAKKQQQFKASDGNQDITAQVAWKTSDTTIATISNFDIHKGLAFAGSKAGTVTVSATDTAGTKSNPDAELCVECWENPGYRQDQDPWIDSPMGHYKTKGIYKSWKRWTNSFGAIGCALTCVSNIANITPEQANTKILASTDTNHQYNGNADISWDILDYLTSNAITEDINNSAISKIEANAGGFVSDPYLISVIDPFLETCHPVVVGIRGYYNNSYYGHHFVLVLKKNKDGSYKIFDPALLTNITTLASNEPIYSNIIYNYK